MRQTSNLGRTPRPTPSGLNSSEIYRLLRQEILGLTLVPGALLEEESLSERFGAARPRVREALALLIGEGLVLALPNRNTIVAMLDFANLPAFLDALLLMYRVSCRLAAEKRTDRDLDNLRVAQDKFSLAVAQNDILSMLRANQDFHLAIAKAGNNPYYTAFFDRLLNEGMRLLRLYYKRFNDRLPPQYANEHDGLIDSIAAQDIERAESLGGAHAMRIVEQLQTLLLPSSGLGGI